MIRCSATGMTMRLEDERDRGGDVEMRRVLDVGLPGDRSGQHQRVQRKDVEQRVEPVLIKLRKLTSTSAPASRWAMSKSIRLIRSSRDTKRSSVPSRPSISAAPRNSGTRNTRILAIDVSNSAEQEAADGELDDIGADADGERRQSGAGRCHAPGREQAGDSET